MDFQFTAAPLPFVSLHIRGSRLVEKTFYRGVVSTIEVRARERPHPSNNNDNKKGAPKRNGAIEPNFMLLPHKNIRSICYNVQGTR